MFSRCRPDFDFLRLHQLDLFRNEQQRLDEAYTRQGERIAYETSETSIEQEE